MASIIQKPRTGCALHGALQTIEELPGVLPILHANSGCGLQSVLEEKAAGRGIGYVSGSEIPSTCSQERHVIFGGASRLREQIKNTVKVQKAGLYVVLNSCEAAMVGDDLESMVEESVEQGNPVISNLSAGFQGGSHFGYEQLFVSLLKKVPALPSIQKPEKGERPVVNIFGILPATDTFWQGDLDAVEEILDALGIEAHSFLRSENAVQEIAGAADADLSIVFSKWGVSPAKALDVPYVRFDSVPYGIKGVENFVKVLSEKLGIAQETADAYIEKERQYTTKYLRRLRDIFYTKRPNRHIALVGDESTVTGIASVLSDYLKADAAAVVLTDYDSEEGALQGKDNATLSAITDNITFSSDAVETASVIQQSGAEVILGSLFEKRAVAQSGKAFLEISEPAASDLIANKSYAGVRGAVRLVEDFFTILPRTRG